MARNGQALFAPLLFARARRDVAGGGRGGDHGDRGRKMTRSLFAHDYRRLESEGLCCAKCRGVGPTDADRLCAECAPLYCDRCTSPLVSAQEKTIGQCADCWRHETGAPLPGHVAPGL